MKRVLVVGGGVAGITVASALEAAGVDFDWVEATSAVGGSLHLVHNPLYGWPEMAGRRGAEAAAELDGLPICARLRRATRVASMEQDGSGFAVVLANGDRVERYRFERVLLCTGTARRAWDVPGAAALRGRGIAYSTHEVGEQYRGEPVAVVGGGDAAVEGALRMAEMGCRVWLLVRGKVLRAHPTFVARLAQTPAVEVCLETEVSAVTGAERLESVVLRNGRSIAVRALFVRVGVAPVMPPILPAPRCDAEGYLVVDAYGHASLPGLFGAGEVTSREVSQVVAVQEQAQRVAARVIAELR